MSRSKQLCLISFTVIFFSLLFNLLFIGNSRADSLVISGSQKISPGSSETLTVSANGCGGPYTWSLSGGGSLSGTTGTSVLYTAPASNASCSNNSLISVTDSSGNKAYIQIAVTAASGYPAYQVKHCSSEHTCVHVNNYLPTYPNAVQETCAAVGRYTGACDGTETYGGSCGGGRRDNAIYLRH